MNKAGQKSPPRSLREFLQGKKVQGCIVCQTVAPELLQQIADAMEHRNMRVDDGLAWLEAEYGIKISREQWQLHQLGRHVRRSP